MAPDFTVTGTYVAPPGHNRYTEVSIMVAVTLDESGSFLIDTSAVPIDSLSAGHIRDAIEQHVSRELLHNRGIAIRLVAIQPDLDWLVPIGCGRTAEIVAEQINEKLRTRE
jgi:xanthine/CO dehydrogenase XdhC/CoxF family maturation factor